MPEGHRVYVLGTVEDKDVKNQGAIRELRAELLSVKHTEEARDAITWVALKVPRARPIFA